MTLSFEYTLKSHKFTIYVCLYFLQFTFIMTKLKETCQAVVNSNPSHPLQKSTINVYTRYCWMLWFAAKLQQFHISRPDSSLTLRNAEAQNNMWAKCCCYARSSHFFLNYSFLYCSSTFASIIIFHLFSFSCSSVAGRTCDPMLTVVITWIENTVGQCRIVNGRTISNILFKLFSHS